MHTHIHVQVLSACAEVSFSDLFCWAVLVGDDDFIFEFWKRAESPARCALLGARLSRAMTSRMQFGKAECLERAEMLESWAVGALTSLPTQLSAKRILSRTLPAWGDSTLLDTAMLFEMKSFLAQMQSQALMDAWWRGDYPGGQLQLVEDYSVSALGVYALLPPLNPFLYGFGQVPASCPKPKSQPKSICICMYAYMHICICPKPKSQPKSPGMAPNRRLCMHVYAYSPRHGSQPPPLTAICICMYTYMYKSPGMAPNRRLLRPAASRPDCDLNAVITSPSSHHH